MRKNDLGTVQQPQLNYILAFATILKAIAQDFIKIPYVLYFVSFCTNDMNELAIISERIVSLY